MAIINYLAIGVVLIVFVLLNYYIGYKGTRFLRALNLKMNNIIYWMVFWTISMGFFVARIFSDKLSEVLKDSLNFVGSLWLGAMLYLLMLLFLFEIINLICRKTGLWERFSISRKAISIYAGTAIIVITGVVLLVGYRNADTPVVSTYEVNIPKKVEAISELNIVMVSDLHLGSSGHGDLLKKMVNEINSLNPDLVLFAGDIIDDDIQPFIERNYAQEFTKIKSKYGMFAVTGNHEYYGGDEAEFVKLFRATGVNVLMDEYVKVADRFYLSGRIDKAARAYSNTDRKDVGQLLEGVDKSLPVILMDHQPELLEKAMEAGVDLQFSGHTHRGQTFPGNILTKYTYELGWGYLKKGNYQIIVSSGLGTWGPPIRVGSKSEIVNAKISFGK